MKRILFVCCLLTASCFLTYTQAAAQTAAPARPTISKSDFTTKVGQLKTLLDAGNATEGKVKWDEVHKLMLNALGVTKYNISDAMSAGNETLKAHYTGVMLNQRKIYGETIKLRDDLVTNRAALNAKLVEFGETIN